MADSIIWCNCGEHLASKIEDYEKAKSAGRVKEYFDANNLKWCCRTFLTSSSPVIESIRGAKVEEKK